MRIRLTTKAKLDLAEALAWYGRQSVPAASRFLDEYESIHLRLIENPQQFPIARGDVRRASFRRYPYGVFYHIQGDVVEVFAVFHSSRDPSRWQGRS